MRYGGALSVAWLVAVSAISGAAQAEQRDAAAAQALFDQARALVQQGHYAEACPKLQESNQLDPGIGTQFHLADCYEHSGKVASAWALFLDVASQARASGQQDRDKAATSRAEKLQPRLPRLQVVVPESSRAARLEIRRNGMLVGAAQWGTPLPVDPGDVELTVSAPGRQTLRQTLHLEEGKTATYAVPVLAEAQATPSAPQESSAAVAPSPPAPTRSDAAPPAQREAPTKPASSKNVGWVVGLAGAGAVGLGISTTFAILAKGKDSDSKAYCSKPNSCDATGVSLRNQAIQKGNVATVAAVAGGVSLAGAALVWILSGRSTDEPRALGTTFQVGADVGANHGAFYLQRAF